MFNYAPVSDIVPWSQSIAGLNQSIFSTTWTANEASDILVYSRAPTDATNDITQLIPSNQYTVQFIGASNIVQVTFGASYIPAQFNIITIMRNTPAEFINLYTNTNFTPSMLNGDFETLTLIDQQNELYDKQMNPRYNNSETLNNPIDLILPILGANQFWVKNANNTGFIAGTVTNSFVAPQVLNSNVPLSSAISLTTLVSANVTELTLTPGTWILSGNVSFDASDVSLFNVQGSISPTSLNFPDFSYKSVITSNAFFGTLAFTVPQMIVTLSTNTTYYLVAGVQFASGTVTACGNLNALGVS